MKINKFFIRICHFFGLLRDQAHIDDVKFKIPTIYPEKDFDIHGPSGGRKDSQWVIDDIKNQVYEEFKKDEKFEKNCNRVSQVWISTEGSLFPLYYKRETLYYPCESDSLIRIRDEKIHELLN